LEPGDPPGEEAMDVFVKALGGGVGGVVSTTILYPMEVTKTKVQASAGGEVGDTPGADRCSP
jgi:hypothetical protein